MYIFDYIIIFLVLCISTSIGVYFHITGKKQKNLQEYLFAEHQMSIWMVSLSVMTSFITAISVLGISNEIYSYGFQFFIINFGYGLFTSVAAFIYLPVFYKLKITNIFYYLDIRFGKWSKFLASLIIILQMLTYNSAVLYTPSITLEQLTNISKFKIIIILGLVCTFYSTIGGIKAVLVTDFFQTFFMFIGALCVIIHGIFEIGSITKIIEIAEIGGRLNFFNLSLDLTTRHTFWNLIIGGGFIYLSLYAINSSQLQKYSTTKNLRSAQLSLILQWPFMLLLSFCTAFSGLVIYSKYYQCDPVLSQKLNKYDGILPYYVSENMIEYYSLPGFFIAGILSASLSTVSTLISNIAFVVYEDYFKVIYKWLYKKESNMNLNIIVVKLLVLMFGILSICFTFILDRYSSILQFVLTLFSAVGGPLVALFTLGMFTTAANDKGSTIAFITGIALTMYLGYVPKEAPEKLALITDGCNLNHTLDLNIFENILKNIAINNLNLNEMNNTRENSILSRLSYMWLSPIGFLITFIIGLILSNILNIFQKNTSKLRNPDVYISLLANYVKKKQYIVNNLSIELDDPKISKQF